MAWFSEACLRASLRACFSSRRSRSLLSRASFSNVVFFLPREPIAMPPLGLSAGGAPRLEHPYVRRGRALWTLLGVVGHLGSLVQRPEAVGHDRGLMDEQVLAAVIRRDEPVALVVTEPLDGPVGHCVLLGSCAADQESLSSKDLRALNTFAVPDGTA